MVYLTNTAWYPQVVRRARCAPRKSVSRFSLAIGLKYVHPAVVVGDRPATDCRRLVSATASKVFLFKIARRRGRVPDDVHNWDRRRRDIHRFGLDRRERGNRIREITVDACRSIYRRHGRAGGTCATTEADLR